MYLSLQDQRKDQQIAYLNGPSHTSDSDMTKEHSKYDSVMHEAEEYCETLCNCSCIRTTRVLAMSHDSWSWNRVWHPTGHRHIYVTLETVFTANITWLIITNKTVQENTQT